MFHSQGGCFWLSCILFQPFLFVMTSRALLALESTACSVGPPSGGTTSAKYLVGIQKNRAAGNWGTFVSNGQSPGSTRCFPERFRILALNFKGLDLIKSFCESLDESSFMVT